MVRFVHFFLFLLAFLATAARRAFRHSSSFCLSVAIFPCFSRPSIIIFANALTFSFKVLLPWRINFLPGVT
ncbi:hypothetical protein V8E51_012439 [Hyaloscypha variabilis]